MGFKELSPSVPQISARNAKCLGFSMTMKMLTNILTYREGIGDGEEDVHICTSVVVDS